MYKSTIFATLCVYNGEGDNWRIDWNKYKNHSYVDVLRKTLSDRYAQVPVKQCLRHATLINKV